ncbi:hypothetical protein DNU06_04385 [Putridiphycobacter roseus]|uniref:DoxX family protein n=1 Tax=Putridiphycobacter roseus TaxID=2219161 RepID=A0A2W1NFI5_9FLAO|nr:DoxX family protein [Putridiphycobacter roseus]PZE17863.1 hypothetical protein DNU06_04385 [Putridiphycobacter roseus]
MRQILDQIINVFSIIVLVFFAVPKIMGMPKSVAGFTQFESVLGINADFFRLFTGGAELLIAILILVYMFTKNNKLGIVAFVFLLATMVSALVIEFLVRPSPVGLLVGIAIILSITSIYKLLNIQHHEKLKR